MKLSLVALMAAASFAAADNCQEGLKYCGFNLLRRGNYYQTIVDLSHSAPGSAAWNTLDDFINSSYWLCTSSATGAIKYEGYCGSPGNCADGGAGKSDICNWKPQQVIPCSGFPPGSPYACKDY
ncbi:hypothetical protein K458DRAFT_421925 [Lentithecium fluviatile CBS 122367]|uniref:Uncharacterized protein n=1 Tax=Lentithecium fluviatile CBS 122367 TaxID=1168545 RepID=A0A6G1INL7_9PLEO|nr:hypothetical protein K458DRAFT_421925 [Lentithecium fluviatile CBS 122367]